MKALIWLVIGMVGMIAVAIGYSKTEENRPKLGIWFFVFFLGAMACGLSIIFTGQYIEREYPENIHSTNFNVKTEIHVNQVDGIETERDTVYIFTPKK